MSVKLYYLFLLAVSLWTAARAAGLARALGTPLTKKLPPARLADDAMPIAVAARAVLAGGVDGPLTAASQERVERLDANVAYLAAIADLKIRAIQHLLCLTVIVSVWSVVADAVPAYSGSSMRIALYEAVERLTTRLSTGLSVAAGLTLTATVFEHVLRRRRADWQFVLATTRMSAQRPAHAATDSER